MKPDLKFEALLSAMDAATGDGDIITVFDDHRLVAFLEFVDDPDNYDEEELCPLCKTGILDEDGGCNNPKCLINRLGGV